MWSSAPKFVFVAALAVNCIIWSNGRYGQAIEPSSLSSRAHHSRRSLTALIADHINGVAPLEDEKCYPIAVPAKQQCAHVTDSCPDIRTFLSIPYLRTYFCTKPQLRPLVFVGYLLWLVFLFSTLGISASDFFCPNLATLANLLGLDENVAGVTFLAFGNGSPDVFATFSAMRTNSGGLAIGELLGAAAFVTSCVVGSMCIIKPFKVIPYPFVRDIGFFMGAVVLLLAVLWDSRIEGWEAAAMIVLYAFYVIVVVGGTMLEKRRERRRRREALLRDEFREEDTVIEAYHDEEPYRDEYVPEPVGSSPTLKVPTLTRSRAASTPGPPRLGLSTELPPRARSRSPGSQSPPSSHLGHMPSFSLIGALEFRRVVSSLQRESSTSSLSVFESPGTPYPGGHYHPHSHTWSHPQSRSRSPVHHDEERDPWDASLGVPLDERSPRSLAPPLGEDGHLSATPAPIPLIAHTPASPTSETDTDSQHFVPPTRRQRVARTVAHTCHVLFPTLHHFWAKTVLGRIAAVLAAPAVMALTVTLPVVVTAYQDTEASREKRLSGEARLVDFEEEGVERTLIAEEEAQDEMHELKFNRWLMAVQCALGPLFTVAILFDGVRHEMALLLAVGISGVAVGLLVIVFSDKSTSRSARLAQCIMGFMVAVVWIMAIADEVVEVLQTFGFIFGLSDAIIGLTIFAVGNSLADLVANMSVAVFAPIMGFSACFGGPMLNILLGVGISGSYIVRKTGHPYHLHFSTTLLVTGAGLLAFLLATLLFVPWNGFFLPRYWGFVLIGAYTCLMVANVVLEVVG